MSIDPIAASTTVGGHEGIEAITGMMTGFFRKFPSVHWEVGEYTISQEYPNSVEFLFVRTGVTNADGENTRQLGKEWVCFTSGPGPDGLAISRIAVETNKTEIIS